MIQKFKVKHDRDFTVELQKVRQVAEFMVRTGKHSTKDVKQFGLKAAIVNSIKRKYHRNKRLKRIHRVNLAVNGYWIRVDKEKRIVRISCLKLELPYRFRNDFTKVNQIELDNQFAYVSVSVPEKHPIVPVKYLGVDRNTTGHIAIVADPLSGGVWKFGGSANHIHNKYSNLRRMFQKRGLYRKAKQIRNRETRIVRDINHKVSRSIVNLARSQNAGIVLERLEGIRAAIRRGIYSRRIRYSLNSWSFYQLHQFIDYKARLEGIPLTYVESRNTSKECSRCGNIGIRDRKNFKCPSCGHVDHADVNASFNIALRHSRMVNPAFKAQCWMATLARPEVQHYER